MRDRLPAAFELAGDTLGLVDEQHHDVKDRLLEMDGLGRVGEFSPQGDHLVIEQLQTLDLDLGARKSIQDRAALVLGLQQLSEDDPDTSRSPTMPPCALISFASGELSNSLTTIGGSEMSRTSG